MSTVRIPTPLRNLTEGQNKVEVSAGTIGQMLQQLELNHPGFEERLLDEGGELRRFVNIYVDGEDIRFREGFDTPITDANEVSIVPSVAGG